MKSLLIAFMFLMSSRAFAQEVFTTVPPALVDSKIQLELKSGSKKDFDGNEYKVVPRESSRKVQKLIDDLRKQLADCQSELAALKNKPATAVVVAPPQQPEVREGVRPADNVNRVAFHAGAGPDGLAVKNGAEGQVITSRIAPLVGLSYARKFGEYSPWSLGAEALMGITLKSRTLIGTLGLGYDF